MSPTLCLCGEPVCRCDCLCDLDPRLDARLTAHLRWLRVQRLCENPSEDFLAHEATLRCALCRYAGIFRVVLVRTE